MAMPPSSGNFALRIPHRFRIWQPSVDHCMDKGKGYCKPRYFSDFQITKVAIKKGVTQTYIACIKKLALRDIAIECTEFQDQKLSVRQGQAEIQGTVHQNPYGFPWCHAYGINKRHGFLRERVLAHCL